MISIYNRQSKKIIHLFNQRSSEIDFYLIYISISVNFVTQFKIEAWNSEKTSNWICAKITLNVSEYVIKFNEIKKKGLK